MSDEALPALVARVRGEGERLLALGEKATERPWRVDGELEDEIHGSGSTAGTGECVPAYLDYVCDTDDAGRAHWRGNSAFIAALANSALPADALALARWAERLEAVVATMLPWCPECDGHGDVLVYVDDDRDDREPCPACSPIRAALAGAGPTGGIYVASRASLPERAAMWRRLRSEGWPIVSTWIDEAGPGQTDDPGELWGRIAREVTGAVGLILYAEPEDFPLKGAMVEVGMALAVGLPVVVVAPFVEIDPRSGRPIGSWMRHPLVGREGSVIDAFRRLGAIAAPAGAGPAETPDGGRET